MPRRRMYFFRYMTMFFLWASAVMLATYATNTLDISTSLQNAVQYIGQIFVTSDGTSNWATGIFIDGTSGGRIGIGTDSPTKQLEILWASGNYVQIGEANFSWGLIDWFLGINAHIDSISGSPVSWLVLAHNIDDKSAFIRNFDGELFIWSIDSHGIYISTWWNIGINSYIPSERLEVGGNGKIKVGDTLKLYSDLNYWYIGWVNKLKFLTNWSTTAMTINTSGYVGIGTTNPTATLELKGTMKILSSLTGKTDYYSGFRWYFPQWVITGAINTWLDTDSIWYLSCDTPFDTTWIIYLYWLTWSNMAWTCGSHCSNAYFRLKWAWNSTLTYHLKAGETFFTYNNCPDGLSIAKQEYGQEVTTQIWWWNDWVQPDFQYSVANMVGYQ